MKKRTMKELKRSYVPPFIEVYAMDAEPILAGSTKGTLKEFEDGGEEGFEDGDL